MRAAQSTLSYGDRISNAPGAETPSRAPALARSTSPSVEARLRAKDARETSATA